MVGGLRLTRLLPARPRPLLPRAALALDGQRRALQPARQGQGAPAPQGGGLRAGSRSAGSPRSEYEFMYKNALVAKQQLEEVGIVVDLQVVDWATLNHRDREAGAVGGRSPRASSSPPTPPTTSRSAARSRAGGATRRRSGCSASCRSESDVKKRKAIVDRIQTVFYEDVGQREARRLLHARRRAPRPARRVPHRAAPVLLEQLAREVGSAHHRVRALDVPEQAQAPGPVVTVYRERLLVDGAEHARADAP